MAFTLKPTATSVSFYKPTTPSIIDVLIDSEGKTIDIHNRVTSGDPLESFPIRSAAVELPNGDIISVAELVKFYWDNPNQQ